MYRVIFRHHPKQGQEDVFIATWKKYGDIIQTYPGALGTKLFRKVGELDFLYAMAEWVSKEARQSAIAAINERPDADEILHSHTQFVDTYEVWGEFDLITESRPPVQ